MKTFLAAVGVAAVASRILGAAPPPLVFTGMCDASAAVALDDDLFAVANDEDNVMRVFRVSQPGAAVQTFNLSPFLRVTRKAPETDLEGAARIGSRVYWITSHGRNATGKPAPNRHRFFATELPVTHGRVSFQPVGMPYLGLIAALCGDPKLARFNLSAAAQLAPKLPGALNIEGLTDTPEGGVLIGFRNPIPNKRALVVPLLNPGEVVTASAAPRFGEPHLLDLGGLGLRAMGSTGKGYNLIAGSADGTGQSKLFSWDGKSERPQLVPGVELPGLNPEGICFHDSSGRWDYLILSDDGTLNIGGKDCKKLLPAQRRFRAFRVGQ